MAVFRDTDHLYEVLDALFRRISADPAIAERLLEGRLVVRFRFTDPEGVVTVDMRSAPIRWTFGESDLPAHVEMIQSADTAHRFWHGRLNVPRAIATRQVIARGSVPKALALLPAIKPAFQIYPQVLRELGYEEMIIREQPAGARRRGVLARLWPRRRRPGPVDFEALSRHRIPLQETVAEEAIRYRDQGLPTDEAALKREMLRRMLLIRAFEERLAQAFAAGQVPSEALHLSIGQEACAVGACFALRTDDYITTTHRGHGHMLAKGADLKAMMAEILGKRTGLCRGLGGPMHVTEAAVGALGANGIVGAAGLIAIGAALSAQRRDSRQVALTFLGDGAVAQGMFHEAVNFAAVFDLPVVFFIENNQYAEFTPTRRTTRVVRLADKAAAYGIPGRQVDGNDVWQVYQAVREAVAQARRGGGPTLIEAVTYRISGHTEGESARYRSEEEIARWQERDPIARWKAALLGADLLDEEGYRAMAEEARRQVEEAWRFAQESPEPTFADVEAVVYAPEPAHLYRPTEPPAGPTRQATVSRALWEALAEEMERDERVYLLGEDVSSGGYFAVTAGLQERFGPQRVMDTPISEYAIVGSAVGAAMTGMRPVAEIMFSDFLTTCMDPLVNQAAKLRLMSGGQYRLPLVVRTPGGAGIGMAAQHSQSWEALLMSIPGLIIVAPSTPYDAKGLLKAAIRSNNPVLFFENKLLYLETGPLPEGEYLVPLGVADVKRRGEDVTIVAVGAMVGAALAAAETLASRGIEAEVVDPRTLVPCDWATILRSVAKTGRLVTVEAGVLTGGFGAEVAARVAGTLPHLLKAPVRRVAGREVPIPYNRALENQAVPGVEAIIEAVEAIFA